MEKFLSCDWGTTSFRLRVADVSNCAIIAEENSNQGIANIFELWKQSGNGEETRLSFYLGLIHQHIKILEKKLNTSLSEVPLIISGMASSTIGMIDIPYKEFPFAANGSDLEIKTIVTADNFTNKTAIISGAKTGDDAVRGEETILAGCFNDDGPDREERVFIFPGTHSKHIVVKKEKAVTVKTYMTGEFFELLSRKSILSVSVEEGKGLQYQENKQSFEKGVRDSVQLNLLHSCFLVRTNQLFDKLAKQQNYYYLSGLLIGTEIKDLMNDDYININLVSNEMLSPYYKTAFNALNTRKSILEIQDTDEALIRGQLKIYKRLLNNEWGI
jgi:2-dehydro-3-deoxygalactonokinase